MRAHRSACVALLCAALASCIPLEAPPSRAAKQKLEADSAATVIFARPARCEGPDMERLVLCDGFAENRIRVVDRDGRSVAELGLRDYAVVLEEPGEHLYVAEQSGTTCVAPRYDC